MTAEIVVDTYSLDSAAGTLRDAAEDLRTGQFDPFLLEWASPPRCPGEISKALKDFAGYAHEQYRNTAGLMARNTSIRCSRQLSITPGPGIPRV